MNLGELNFEDYESGLADIADLSEWEIRHVGRTGTLFLRNTATGRRLTVLRDDVYNADGTIKDDPRDKHPLNEAERP